jgi:putative protein-disulfide isomerase
MKQPPAILYYFHDPMCSWCWGFKKAFQQLCEDLPEGILVKRVLGGLAPDSDEPMPGELRQQIKSGWLRIEAMIPGVTFNFDFWQKCQPRRSTYAACRAVIAARQQGEQYDVLMTNAIQDAYYQQARNPSDDETLIALAAELGIDRQRFIDDFFSHEVKTMLQQEIDFSRHMFVESFPSLVLKVENKTSGIEIDYTDYATMLKQIREILNAVY